MHYLGLKNKKLDKYLILEKGVIIMKKTNLLKKNHHTLWGHTKDTTQYLNQFSY